MYQNDTIFGEIYNRLQFMTTDLEMFIDIHRVISLAVNELYC